MKQARPRVIDRLANWLTLLFALERIVKFAAVTRFFRRAQPEQPQSWPGVTLLQPLTRGASNLPLALRSRALLDYPAGVQHLLICDAGDDATQRMVSDHLAEFPGMQAEMMLVEPDKATAAVASKMKKLQATLPRATGEVYCFIDDDVTLRPDALRVLLPHLYREQAGVVFGLPCFTNWQTPWSSLVGMLVNAHMLLNFVTLTYFTTPIRINGHVFAFRRATFERVGGLDGLETQIDDEYEIARRVKQYGYKAMQTPLIYDIDNALDSARAYARQCKRWFVMPRQSMMPALSLREKLVFSLFSFTLPMPGIIALLALLSFRGSAWRGAALCLAVFGTVYALCERVYLRRSMPLQRWLLLPVVAFFVPLQILWTLLLNNEVEWRGQRLRLRRDGSVEIVA
ncbi:MAG TPA: glycosyltransferase [Ktedonobacteraceae bacterium]|nr:glycosyltransferase [Ktedonobacteraceae bacterium]